MVGVTKELFDKIYNCENETELNDLVINDNLLSDNSNWKPYGNNGKNNFGTFENQQSNPVPALIEKITNSIDASLLKKCKELGIDPKSKDAPESMAAAVEKFYGIRNGDFSEVSATNRRQIAEDIQIIASGDKTYPNITIYDNGEGQIPNNFDSTFLSLYKGNKADIQFVQGKYNMGSTGAVIFCGNHRYQLIASRFNVNSKGSGEFGYTLVRRHPLIEEDEETRSWYEYFTFDNKIPQFEIDKLDLGLWNRDFTGGSIVKLFSYQLPRGSRSDITFDLWRDLNQYLYHPALPFLVYEKRYGAGHSPTKLVLGNKTRLVLDEREKKETPVTISLDSQDMGAIPIEVTVFKKDVNQKEFVNEKAVVFTVNGQVHGTLPRRFISQDLKFSMLRDSMLINVDCTNVKKSFRQDLFMASRDRMNDGEKTQLLLDKLINVLSSNTVLKELNQKRKDALLHENLEDRDLLEKVMSNIPIDKDLLNLLKKDGTLNIFKTPNNKTASSNSNGHNRKISKRFPSIFKINMNQTEDGKLLKSIPLNGKGIIKFETDVEDEYLFRPKEKGELQLLILGSNSSNGEGGGGKPTKVHDLFEITKEGPNNNEIKITFEPKRDLNVGDEIELSAKLTSPDGDLECIFWVKIVEPNKGKESKKKKEIDNPSLPIPIKVFEQATSDDDKVWTDYGWDGNDILKIILSDDGESLVQAIAINMDSYALKKYISSHRITSANQIKLVKDKYFLSVYLHSLFLYGILDKINKNESNPEQLDLEVLLPQVFKPYSTFLIASNTDDAILESIKED